MKIIHLNGYFKEDLAYQENLLTVGQVEHGHEVYLLTGRYEPAMEVNKGNRTHPVGNTKYKGVEVIRFADFFELTNRMVMLKNIVPLFRKIKPDIIFFHDVSPNIFYGLIYKLFNPKVQFHIDCHSDEFNSRNSVWGPAYHWFWKIFFKVFGKYFVRFFCVAPETIDFVEKFYAIPKEKLILLPLPGDACLLQNYESVRMEVRNELGLNAQHQVIIHSGKLPHDKETLLVLQTFTAMPDPNLRLVIAGSIEEHFQEVFNQFLQKDERILFIGWVKPEKLRRIFCACDVLLQPGSLSNIFLDAICNGLPVILNDTPQGRSLTEMNNGELLKEKSVEEIKRLLAKILGPEASGYKARSRKAANHYHYKNVAQISLQ